MGNRRIEKGVNRGKPFEIEVDGEKLVASEGETVAAVLVARAGSAGDHSEGKGAMF